MHEESSKITEAELKAIAQKTKSEFGGKPAFTWSKGKYLATYVDKNNGYQFQLLVSSKQVGKSLVENY